MTEKQKEVLEQIDNVIKKLQDSGIKDQTAISNIICSLIENEIFI